MIKNSRIYAENIYVIQMGWLLRCSRTFITIIEAVKSGEFGAVKEIRFRRASGFMNSQIIQEEPYQPDWKAIYRDELLYDLETLFQITGPLPLQSVTVDQYGLMERSRLETAFVFSLANGARVSYTSAFSASRNRAPSRSLTVTFEKFIFQILFVTPAGGGMAHPCFNREIIGKQWSNNMTVRMIDLVTKKHTRTLESFPIFSNVFYIDPEEYLYRNLKFEGVYRFIHNS